MANPRFRSSSDSRLYAVVHLHHSLSLPFTFSGRGLVTSISHLRSWKAFSFPIQTVLGWMSKETQKTFCPGSALAFWCAGAAGTGDRWNDQSAVTDPHKCTRAAPDRNSCLWELQMTGLLLGAYRSLVNTHVSFLYYRNRPMETVICLMKRLIKDTQEVDVLFYRRLLVLIWSQD